MYVGQRLATTGMVHGSYACYKTCLSYCQTLLPNTYVCIHQHEIPGSGMSCKANPGFTVQFHADTHLKQPQENLLAPVHSRI